MPPQVTVSVVSHGQEKLTASLLSNFSSLGLDYVSRIVITHNLPTSEVGCAKGPDDRCIATVNAHPQGFGANHNAAFARCNTVWFAVVNPDIHFEEDVFAQLLALAQPQDAVLAPMLIDPQTGQSAPNRGLITPWEILRRRLPGWRAPAEPAWFPGAFLLIRASAFRAIGGFDERFHLYAEDFDLCARLRLAGWRLHAVPQVRVWHAAQRSSHVRWRYLRWHLASLLRLWLSPVFWRYRASLRQQVRDAHDPDAHRPR